MRKQTRHAASTMLRDKAAKEKGKGKGRRCFKPKRGGNFARAATCDAPAEPTPAMRAAIQQTLDEAWYGKGDGKEGKQGKHG